MMIKRTKKTFLMKYILDNEEKASMQRLPFA
jgi:hypothetical protein